MFHWRDGWYFSRTGADIVVIEHHVYGTEKNELGQLMYTIDVKIAIPGSEWASIVAAVSATGETSETYWKALAFHNDKVYDPHVDESGAYQQFKE